jgi:hypothetical protein
MSVQYVLSELLERIKHHLARLVPLDTTIP